MASTPAGREKCFVVMPFGRKPLNDGSSRLYDFDKVYRVVIKPAIRLAGLVSCRADEQKGGLVHAEMFQALRDCPVVLADLSLLNPNVFYELGIRHGVCRAGTVLICRAGTSLPFDLNHVRVFFYHFDGESFDVEEARRLVKALRPALKQARQGEPDSPFHALTASSCEEAASIAQWNEHP